MSGSVKISGVWKTSTPYLKASSVWRLSKSGWVKVAGAWQPWFLQGGLNNSSYSTYDSANRANGLIRAVVQQSDGKILVGGEFTAWNGVTTNRIFRLNSDGTRDTAFDVNIGIGPNNAVYTIVIQSDGKILVGGAFTTWNSVTVNYIVRLNSNGTRDTAFTTNVGTGANNTVWTIAVQSDGKIILGGGFASWTGVTVNRIVRLNSDGTRDTAFNTNTGTAANNVVVTIAIQSDGKIVAGGYFLTWNGVTVNRIVRLNSDGTRDTAFTTNAGTAANSALQVIAVQADGKIVTGGGFSTWNGVTVNYIVRLNSDGTRDTAFTTNAGTAANSSVYTSAIQSDGKIVIGGAFSTWNGVTVNRIVRLNSDGTRDTAFTTNTGTAANSYVQVIAVQADGKIVIGGGFTIWNGVAANYAIRINADGTNSTTPASIDGSCLTAANGYVNSVAVQSNGKVVVGGGFTAWNGVTANNIVRLNLNGTQDTTFTTNTGSAANAAVVTVAIQSDGKILLGGDFTTWNGVTVNRIVRLNSDGTMDTAFTTNAGTGTNNTVWTIAVQSDGKIVVGGGFTTWNSVAANFIVRLNSDGTRDTAFTTNVGTAANSSLTILRIQSDGKILVGGYFATWNGVTVNRIVRLNSDGTRDTAFTTNAGTGANSAPQTIAVQADGKIVVGGAFTTWGGVTVNYIVRLNSDGTRDTAFTTNTGTAANSVVYTIAIQSDGKIVVGGDFITWGGVTVNYIVRLNSDGTRDTAFTTNAGTGANKTVWTSVVLVNGFVMIAGYFSGYNQINRSTIAVIGGGLAA